MTEMKRQETSLWRIITVVSLFTISGAAHAIPALQLGPGTIGNWTYDDTTKTWVTTSDTFTMNGYANAITGNGDYAWDPLGAADQYAYLVLAATPDIGNVVDGFDVSIAGDGGALSLIDSGYGTPPLNDPNSLAGHGIFDTYFEVYEFQFNGPVTTISDIQPGGTGTGDGFVETFDVTVNDLFFGALGVHFDLFTVDGDGRWDPTDPADRKMVNAFAPFSHDAAYVVPVPAAFWLFGTALIGFIGFSRRRMI